MTYVTSEDVFFGRKQEDFDLAEKLLIKHGRLSDKCVREMADATYNHMGMVECHKILKRVWDDMRVKRLEDENAKLREQVLQLQLDWEGERDYAEQMEAKEKMAVAKNDKLRELAAETIRLMQADGPDCGLCKHYDECWAGEAMSYSPTGCVICNEARELGIEV